MTDRVVRLVVVAVGLGAVVSGAAPPRETTAFVNGRWFVNGKFTAPGTRYVQDGTFVARPGSVDRAVDLGRRFIVPPFGEAHNHNTSAKQLATYFEQGIFYVKNPNSFPGDRARAAGLIDTPATPDVVFANGGLTSPGGHPISLIDRGIARGTMTEADGDGAFYHGIADRAELDRRWPAVLAARPDFIKVYLLFSEEFALRRASDAARGWRGLDPALLPEVVRRAHVAGLRVSAHVESAADLALAVDAGEDEANHLPGFRGPAPDVTLTPERFAISEALARRAAASKTVVVTTVSGIEELPDDDSARELRRVAEPLYAASLRRLHEAGAALAIGSDRYAFTSRDEARYLHRLGVFDTRTLLRLWCEVTPNTIFPGRRIGRLETGAEASFLALDRNPLDDFDAIRRIVLRVKQGVVTGRSPVSAAGGGF